MSEYSNWEGDVTDEVSDLLGVSRSDGAGVVESQDFLMRQAWGTGLDAAATAQKIVSAIQS